MQVSPDQLWSAVAPRLRERVDAGLPTWYIAKFCGATVGTVTDWLTTSKANGERLLRLWHILAIAGSPSPELEEIPELNRYLSELFALRVISGAEAEEIAGISAVDSSYVYGTLRGTPVQHPKFSVHELRELYDAQLHDAKQAIVDTIAAFPASSAKAVAPVVSSPDVRLTGDDYKVTLASLLGAALPLATYLVSDNATPGERSSFRDLVGAETLFELTNTLSALSSERARGLAR